MLEQLLKIQEDQTVENQLNKCAPCLDIIDQTVIVPCQHSEYCFKCMRIWSNTSNRCPICVQPIDHLVHRIDPLTKDFQTFHPLPIMPSLNADNNNRRTNTPTGHALNHPPATSLESGPPSDHLLGLDRRKFIYCQSLYHPSRPTSGDSPSAKLIARTTRFLQRELRAFETSHSGPPYRPLHSTHHSDPTPGRLKQFSGSSYVQPADL
ncbi:hypothetical protein Pst134EB_007904 [Puccinia striiformis f. sp. tritici]|nr:hypothetical protein Pst134EB_007904 [Puccinia striiformis f. sp. tritici]